MLENGIILVNKERGVSSNFVVSKIKRVLHLSKVGHFGTLDVLGEGLLPIAIGKGTKLFDFFLNKDKVYRTIFKFGETTATLDSEGEIIAKDEKIVQIGDVVRAANKFKGKYSQMPPTYSAKKINGKRAYDLARAGEEFNLKPKEIEIYDIKVLKQLETNTFELEVWCSSGTYIRALCRDIAEELNTFGVMLFIQRTRCGIFDLKDAFTLEEIESGKFNVVPLDYCIDYPPLNVNKLEGEKLLNGVKIAAKETELQNVKCYCEGKFLGIGNIENNLLKLNLRLC